MYEKEVLTSLSFLVNKIFEDGSEVYGEGFRKSFAAWNKYGLKNVLSHVKHCGELPI